MIHLDLSMENPCGVFCFVRPPLSLQVKWIGLRTYLKQKEFLPNLLWLALLFLPVTFGGQGGFFGLTVSVRWHTSQRLGRKRKRNYLDKQRFSVMRCEALVLEISVQLMGKVLSSVHLRQIRCPRSVFKPIDFFLFCRNTSLPANTKNQ